MCELKEFDETIRKFAKNKSANIINNKGVGHAACLMSAIFDNSKKIKMLSGSLSRELTDKDEYMDSLSAFLKREDTKLDLLLEFCPEENNRSKALKLIMNSTKTTVKILTPENLSFIKSKNEGKSMHFALGDDKIYRFEYNTDEYKAQASFNRSDLNEILGSLFEKVSNDAVNQKN